MNKVLIKLYLPIIEQQYDVWIPLEKEISKIIAMLVKGVNELRGENYYSNNMPVLYNKITGIPYDIETIVSQTNIRNGTELILI